MADVGFEIYFQNCLAPAWQHPHIAFSSMQFEQIEFVEINPTEVPFELLLEADPDETSIKAYLTGSWCFVAKEQDNILGACLVKSIDVGVAEIFNVSVQPALQGKGVGTHLLKFVLGALVGRDVNRVELGTGAFGYQLAYYHKLGFRVDRVLKNHFLDHYPEPIFENGIQHKDMLRLYLDLKSRG